MFNVIIIMAFKFNFLKFYPCLSLSLQVKYLSLVRQIVQSDFNNKKV